MTNVAGDARQRLAQQLTRRSFPSERAIVGPTFPAGGRLAPAQFQALQRQRVAYARRTGRPEPGIT